MAFERSYSRNVSDAGTLDRRVTIMAKHPVQDIVFGTETITWQPFADVAASVQDILPSRAERMAPGVNLATKPCIIRIRYLAGITADMRVRYGERTLQIIAGPSILGRNMGIELMAEEVSTQGEAA